MSGTYTKCGLPLTMPLSINELADTYNKVKFNYEFKMLVAEDMVREQQIRRIVSEEIDYAFRRRDIMKDWERLNRR